MSSGLSINRLPQTQSTGVSFLFPGSDPLFPSNKQNHPAPIGSPADDRSHIQNGRANYVHKPYDLFCSDSNPLESFIVASPKQNGRQNVNPISLYQTNVSSSLPTGQYLTPQQRFVKYQDEKSPNTSPMRYHPSRSPRVFDGSPPTSPVRSRRGDSRYSNDRNEFVEDSHDQQWDEWITGMGGMEGMEQEDFSRNEYVSRPTSSRDPSPSVFVRPVNPTIYTADNYYYQQTRKPPQPQLQTWTDPPMRKVRSPSPHTNVSNHLDNFSPRTPSPPPLLNQNKVTPSLYGVNHKYTLSQPFGRETYLQNSVLSQSAPDITVLEKMQQPNSARNPSPFRTNRPQETVIARTTMQRGNNSHAEGSKLHFLNVPNSPPSSPILSPHPSPSKNTKHPTASALSSSPPHHHSQYRYRHKAKANRQRYSNKKEDDLAKYEIHLEKVLIGDDLRTTLMVKNIPNKYDQEMLLETVNKKFKGTYDFFYLPIDFKNKCNVGYAFINFIEPTSVAKFFEDFNQKRWEKFNSEKVCSIAYARIQGKIAFIDHFRNSSLMCEDPSCRPLIFYSSGSKMGTLELFPPANISPSKARYVSNTDD